MKIYSYVFLLLSCFLLASCTQDNDWVAENPEIPQKGTVRLNLQSASINVDTRSTTPQDPQTDNPMYDLCLLHYNFEGQLVETKTISFRGQTPEQDQPELSYTWTQSLTIDPQRRSETICLVANMVGNYPSWPVRLADLKELSVNLKYDMTNGLIEYRRMYMFGYYEGPVTAGADIHILMGRMAAALKFVITAPDVSPAAAFTVNSIEILNAPMQGYFYPTASTGLNFGTILETFAADNQIISNTGELIYYYQIGENITPEEAKRTKVRITGSYSVAQRVYTVDLGCDPPSVPDAERNYSLYRNNNYTFHIALKY